MMHYVKPPLIKTSVARIDLLSPAVAGLEVLVGLFLLSQAVLSPSPALQALCRFAKLWLKA